MFNTSAQLKFLCSLKGLAIGEEAFSQRAAYIFSYLELNTPFRPHFHSYRKEMRHKKTNVIAPIIVSENSRECIVFLAHHDVANIKADNCFDNSASVINLLHLVDQIKNDLPPAPKRSLVICFTDEEETGGIGASFLFDQLKEMNLGEIVMAINLDWTGKGTDIAMEEIELNGMSAQFRKALNAQQTFMLFNDSVILRKKGIHSFCLALGYSDEPSFNFPHLDLMHSVEDTIALANIRDMNSFVLKLKKAVYELL